ncbi:MarR family transcriptional regulator [Geodermatophilus tzadiensis]|uniref:MarR family transcriptional regulator n=1 Tax=Geodermatophilus tzadiensis TaxID=1137988 RepID=A0A2T0TPW8_9ACTN|nr:MarR family transcriptional regulator [Geodermatophilus tzadiensis]
MVKPLVYSGRWWGTVSDPVNGEPLVVVLLEHAMHRVRAELYALSDESFPGLRTRHYRLLSFLPPGGERLTRLTAASGLTKQALAQALAPLQAGGYVEVVPDPSDRRARLVRLTDRGREATAAVRHRLAAVEREWAARVGEERYAVARAVLTDLAPGPVTVGE